MRRELRNAALAYADRGWHVLPLKPGGKVPLGRLVPNGLNDATADLATVFRWWQAAPNANIGIVCGPSGMVALDVDPRHGGDDTLHELERRLGRLPDTPRALTGGGGEHYLLRHPGEPIKGKAGEGVDTRDQAYIVAPPSRHPSGGRYEWDVEPDEADVAPLPPRWLDHLRQPRVALRRPGELRQRLDHDDPLRRIPADVYVPALTGRTVHPGGWVQCPFHKGGQERTPSMKVDGGLWACYACPPLYGRSCMGGNIYDFAGLLAGYAVPLRGFDFVEVKRRLETRLG